MEDEMNTALSYRYESSIESVQEDKPLEKVTATGEEAGGESSTSTARTGKQGDSASSDGRIDTSASVNSRESSETTKTMDVASEIHEIIDIDANFTHPDLHNDVDPLLKVALASGVQKFIVPGATLEESKAALQLAQKYKGIMFSTVGIHPYNVSQVEGDVLRTIEDFARREEVVALGEMGLDYSPSFPDKSTQLKWFLPQLELACKIGKPIFLHERLAHEDFMEAMEKNRHNLPPAVVHCFTGTRQELNEYLKFGFYIGVSGFICKKKHGEELRTFLKDIPMDRLMIETDAPYMGFPGCRALASSQTKRQYPNVPSSLRKVLLMVSECLGLPPSEVARATTENAKKFFRI